MLLTEKGLAPTRSRARALIMEGVVLVDGQKEDKPGSMFAEESEIRLKEDPIPFVSRGGLKIQKALHSFGIDLSGVIAADIGASTGGFTDCMLKSGAASVYAIDVGYGQLDYGLRCDERVVVMERTNVRNLPAGALDPAPSFASIDVSFISLKKVLPVVKSLMAPGSSIVALIKPQFEAGREQVGKNGVVRDIKVHEEVVRDIVQYAYSIGYSIVGLDYSPIKGPKGNIEFLICLKDGEALLPEEGAAESIVRSAHEEIGNIS